MNMMVGRNPKDMDRLLRRHAALAALGPIMISPTMTSNLFTMGAAAKQDRRQAIPAELYVIPSPETRRVRARLVLEEALELIKDLGFKLTCEHIQLDSRDSLKNGDLVLHDTGNPDLWGVIDSCIDVNYVTTGTLAAFGVPDAPHIHAVNEANDNKFPKGVATVDANGKYTKPDGWQPPDHEGAADVVKKAAAAGVCASLYAQSQVILSTED